MENMTHIATDHYDNYQWFHNGQSLYGKFKNQPLTHINLDRLENHSKVAVGTETRERIIMNGTEKIFSRFNSFVEK